MKTTVTMILMFALMATGLMAQPNPATDGDFNCYQYVGTALESAVAVNGQLPDGEVGLRYDDAHVQFKDAEQSAPVGYYLHGYSSVPPAGLVLTNDYHFVNGSVEGEKARITNDPSIMGMFTISVRAAYKKIAGYPASWPDVWYGPIQDYTIQIHGGAYGVQYPPLLNGGSSGSGGGGGDGGDDANCSAVAGAGYGMPAALATVLGALVWRRRRKGRL